MKKKKDKKKHMKRVRKDSTRQKRDESLDDVTTEKNPDGARFGRLDTNSPISSIEVNGHSRNRTIESTQNPEDTVSP